MGAKHRGGTAHVVFHFVHGASGLDGNAARVKGNAFPNQHDRPVGCTIFALTRGFAGFGGGAFAFVMHDDESWGFGAAACHR